MRISQKLEYACRALAQLAKNFDGNSITRLEEIAQREAVSSSFLVQILNELRKGEIISSKRGKQGGYFLSRPPKQISLYAVVHAVDPALITTDISNDGESGGSVSLTWTTLSNDFSAELKKITLEDLITQEDAGMFYI